MKHSYIAKRFQSSAAGLSLDTEALAKYKDIIDLSIGDTDFTTDESIINAAFRDAKAGHTHYGDPKGDPELIDAVCRAWEEDFGQRLPRDHVLVIYDDVSLPLGKLRIRDKGSAGGHNGIKNNIAHLGTDVFTRVKVGVGAPSHPDYDMVDWVIGSCSAQEKKIVDEALDRALDAAECIISRGVTEAQNRFN